MILLIDIGNTAIKWGFSTPKPVILAGRENYQHKLPKSRMLAKWQTLPKPTSALISNVATAQIGTEIKALIKAYWNIEAVFIQENQTHSSIKPLITHGILGVDRWLALLAICQTEPTPFAVIGCGTAITLDVCQNRTHLGGLITPGIKLMRLALEDYTAGCRLNPAQSDPNHLLAFNTDGAMRAGTLEMAAAFIETTLEKVEKQHNLSLKTFITGGDANQLMPRFHHPARFIEIPALVLNGLALFESAIEK